MADYQLLPFGSVASGAAAVLRTADGVSIAADPGDTGWQAYLTWLAGAGVPDPVPGTSTSQLTPLAFIARFTTPEQIAIATAAQVSAPMLLWLTQASAASYIDLADTRTIDGIAALVTAGLLTAPRAAVILAP